MSECSMHDTLSEGKRSNNNITNNIGIWNNKKGWNKDSKWGTIDDKLKVGTEGSQSS